MSEGQFSVYQFFPDDNHERVCSFVDGETAVRTAIRLTGSLGAKLGMTRRVIITDALDCTCFEWVHGKGVTYPSPLDPPSPQPEDSQ